ncbi:MAG TPA: hypothetical protein VKU02_26185 [Gemmataceae bacterium]|nr:hypothetical protein [Gemmataceae bacterium]
MNDPKILEQVALQLPPQSKMADSPEVDELCSLLVNTNSSGNGRVRRYNLLYWGVGRVARTLDRDEVFQALEALLHLVVSTRSPRKLFVRAAVVGWHGRAVVICGPSGSGKTTLAEALIRAGATYYSDQYAVFDSRGRVYPYPNPLTFRDADGDATKKCSAEMLGGRMGTKPLPVGLVVFTQYRSGARWRPGVLTEGQALLALLGETVPIRRRPKRALTICRRVAEGATVLRGKRGEANELAGPLLNRLCSIDHDRRLVLTSEA